MWLVNGQIGDGEADVWLIGDGEADVWLIGDGEAGIRLIGLQVGDGQAKMVS